MLWSITVCSLQEKAGGGGSALGCGWLTLVSSMGSTAIPGGEGVCGFLRTPVLPLAAANDAGPWYFAQLCLMLRTSENSELVLSLTETC